MGTFALKGPYENPGRTHRRRPEGHPSPCNRSWLDTIEVPDEGTEGGSFSTSSELRNGHLFVGVTFALLELSAMLASVKWSGEARVKALAKNRTEKLVKRIRARLSTHGELPEHYRHNGRNAWRR